MVLNLLILIGVLSRMDFTCSVWIQILLEAFCGWIKAKTQRKIVLMRGKLFKKKKIKRKKEEIT